VRILIILNNNLEQIWASAFGSVWVSPGSSARDCVACGIWTRK